MSIFDNFSEHFLNTQPNEYTLEEYLELCKADKMAYASAAERLLEAIGEPELINTDSNDRLARIFCNRTIRVYPAFRDFYGIEDTVESIVGFLRHAAQGLEEKRQVLYLLGPVGSAKSSIAERLKYLMEKFPIYVLKAGNDISPIFESPLGLFDADTWGDKLEYDYGIHRRYLNSLCSPWAQKRLMEFGGDIRKFKVVKMMPSRLKQVAIVKTEPGDDNNQDISSLVGKVDLRMLEDYSQNDADAYSFSGALCRGNQGVMEFVEMFKAPIKMLHPLLTATQEGNYKGTENIPAIPFNGIILAHSNETEWKTFKNNKTNEAFIDRICVVKVPYNVRVDEEVKIYSKYLQGTDLKNSPCAPHTLRMLAEFTILSRLIDPVNSRLESKMRVYNGESVKDIDPMAKSIQEYRDAAGVDEGMSGVSTRFAFKALNKTFNFDTKEVAADPVHLMYVLEKTVIGEQYADTYQNKLIGIIKDHLQKEYLEFLEKELQQAYVPQYESYGQNIFDRYISMADAWLNDHNFKNPDTGNMFDKEDLNIELEKIEKKAFVVNVKDFRSEVVNFCLRYRASNSGNNPHWASYEKLKRVIEQKMFSNIQDLLPVISFDAKRDEQTQAQHRGFVDRMVAKGYTELQIKRLVEFYARAKNTR